MIQFKFEKSYLDDLWLTIDDKIAGVQEMANHRSKTQMNKAIFTITSKKFIKDFSMAAKKSPKRYHHMFEWGEVSNPAEKLFKITRSKVSGGALDVTFTYKKSKKPVPIPKELQAPGKNGKSVSKLSVFKNKAEVMESGRPVSFTTRNYIAFLSKRGTIQFVPPNKNISIRNPGGRLTSGAFETFAERWYETKADSAVMSSGLFRDIGREASRVMNESKRSVPKVREAIRLVTEKYAQGIVEL